MFNLRLNLRPLLGSVRLYSTQPVVGISRNFLKNQDSRKTYLINRYKMLFDQSEIVLFAHHNNLVKAETNSFRNEIKALGGELSVVRNKLLLSYLRAENESNPASKEAYLKTKDIKHPFAPLLIGPTAIITISTTDPSVVKKIIKFAKSTNEKLFIVGARIDRKLYDLEKINEFKELPTQEELHAQLAGLLTIMSGAGLVQTLQTTSQMLYLTLDSHQKNTDPFIKSEEETK